MARKKHKKRKGLKRKNHENIARRKKLRKIEERKLFGTTVRVMTIQKAT